MSVYEWAGIPETLGVGFVVAALYAVLAHFMAGHDLGPVNFPDWEFLKKPFRQKWWSVLIATGLLAASIAGFFPLLNKSESIPYTSGENIDYTTTAPPVRGEDKLWLSNLVSYLQDVNLDSGLGTNEFQLLMLETKPLRESSRRLTLSVTPVNDKLKFETAQLFHTRLVDSTRFFTPIDSSRSGRGFEAVGLKSEQGDSILCVLEIRKSKDAGVSFPGTSELDTSFKVVVK